MNEHESGSAPDQTAYNAMESVAAASGAGGEARRQEMTEWSEAQGKLAETQATRQHNAEQQAIKAGGSPEEVEHAMASANNNRPTTVSYEEQYEGALILPVNRETVQMRATEDGSIQVDSKTIEYTGASNGIPNFKTTNEQEILRSPASINKPESAQEAA